MVRLTSTLPVRGSKYTNGIEEMGRGEELIPLSAPGIDQCSSLNLAF
jgi:hypothetical protein